MIFRNKFLHDLEYNSFQDIFKHIDNGIINRFKNFLDSDDIIENEPSCTKAMENLFKSNLLVLRQKLDSRKQRISSLIDIFDLFKQQSEIQIDIFFNFLDDLIQLLINETIETNISNNLLNKILLICDDAGRNGYQNNNRLKEILEQQSSLFLNKSNFRDFFKDFNYDKIRCQISELKSKIELNIKD